MTAARPLAAGRDPAYVAEQLRRLVAPGRVVELRAIKVHRGRGRPHTEAGFFDYEHLDDMAAAAVALTPLARGVYFTLNPLRPELLARRVNRTDYADDGALAKDRDVAGRRWLLVDADPVRDPHVSATDAEKGLAREVVGVVREHLAGRGWPAPVLADSGNGFHLLYPLDLPADDGGLVRRVLQALGDRFDTPAVTIDRAVYNPSRICKVPGTLARKGDSTDARPHRASRLLDVPESLAPVPRELLDALAGEAPEPPGPASRPAAAGGYASRLAVGRWLADRGVRFRVKPEPDANGRTVYVLAACPFDASHADPDACVMQAADGELSAHCFHNSCVGHGWQAFKRAIGPPDPAEHYDPPLTGKARTPGRPAAVPPASAERIRLSCLAATDAGLHLVVALCGAREVFRDTIELQSREQWERAAETAIGNAYPDAERAAGDWLDAERVRLVGELHDFAKAPPGRGPSANGKHPPPAQPKYRFIDHAEFRKADYRVSWFVDWFLARGQPAVVAGPSKGMKTSVLVDLAVSLATATPHLGRWNVKERVRVALVSGESGGFTLQETARRIVAAKGLSEDAPDGWLKWEFTLPTLADLIDTADFAKQLGDLGCELVVIDPFYLTLGEIDAKNMFEMGRALRAVAELLLVKHGVTPVIAHHANRMLPIGEVMELQHLAYSGLEQFARQYVFLNRRTSYENDGRHDLWYRYGGSAGHSGLYVVGIDEGVLGPDTPVRRWDVEVTTPGEARTHDAEVRRAELRTAAATGHDADDLAVLAAIDAEWSAHGRPATRENILTHAGGPVKDGGVGERRVNESITRLLEAEAIERCPTTRSLYRGGSRSYEGFRRKEEG